MATAGGPELIQTTELVKPILSLDLNIHWFCSYFKDPTWVLQETESLCCVK